MSEEIYSYTSNVAKLLKHLDKLQNLQNGMVSPVMVHAIPTHKCQLNCVHCCFKNKEDKNRDMPLEVWEESIRQLHSIGVNAIEYTGGGDPLMWPYINEATTYAKKFKFHVGLITNGIGVDSVEKWEDFNWVRISLNSFDYNIETDIDKLRGKTEVSFCYIWNELSDDHIDEVVKYANAQKIPCRLAPDCIRPLDEIDASIKYIRKVLKGYTDNKYVTLSDFNIDLIRQNNDCRIHMIKPCLYLDGWLYSCPSSELAIENNKQINKKFRVCKHDDIERFYNSDEAVKSVEHDCSYCKYVQQQELLEALLMETKFNDFA